MPSSADDAEPLSNGMESSHPQQDTVASDGMRQSEADSGGERPNSLDLNSEDSINAVWCKLQQENTENEVFDSLEDDTDIRFKLPGSSSGTTAQTPLFTGHLLIVHFRVAFCLCFKTSPGAQPFIWKWSVHCLANQTHFHKKGCTPGLVLKQRQIVHQTGD